MKKNGLESIDLSGLSILNNLCLKDNELTSLDLSDNNCLKELSIRTNLIIKFDFLPPSLEKIWADRDPLLSYDYKDLSNLTILRITGAETEKDQFINLNKKVRI